jgi:hypothetical protein
MEVLEGLYFFRIPVRISGSRRQFGPNFGAIGCSNAALWREKSYTR